MDTLIGIYNDHERAVAAVARLKDRGYPMHLLTIIGKAGNEEIDSQMHITEKNPLKLAELAGTTVVGTALGILTGVGLFAIPGLGFLYGAGALVGAIAGFDFGLIGGGIATVLATIGVQDEYGKRYHNAIAEGKFLLIAHGSKEEVTKAQQLLNEGGNDSGMLMH